jgi:hypothetical protein
MTMSAAKRAKILELKEAVVPHMTRLQAAKEAITDLENDAAPAIKALVEEAPPGTPFVFGTEKVKFRKRPGSETYYPLPYTEEEL